VKYPGKEGDAKNAELGGSAKSGKGAWSGRKRNLPAWKPSAADRRFFKGVAKIKAQECSWGKTPLKTTKKTGGDP